MDTNRDRILVNYAGDHIAWTDVVEFLAEDMAIIEWTQPDGTVVRGMADYEGDKHPETGEPVWTWDGCFDMVGAADADDAKLDDAAADHCHRFEAEAEELSASTEWEADMATQDEIERDRE